MVSLVAFARVASATSTVTPIYLEDSHAGSFYWLAEHLDLDSEYTLIHFDAHSDASALFDSDVVRRQLRHVVSSEERGELLGRWRQAGVIQCFNWIEPLMPAPISRLIWVRKNTLRKAEAASLKRIAIEYLDGQLEGAPRAAGSFSKRCQVVGLDKLEEIVEDGAPIVITIDLDYFTGVDPKVRSATFAKVWKFVARCRNLRAVTLAISRPYLSSDDEADTLVRLTLSAALSLPTAQIQFEPFATVGPDRSLRAQKLQSQGRNLPVFTLESASDELRALILANRERIAVRTDISRWQNLLAQWENEAPAIHLSVKNHEPSTDTIWRLPVTEPAELELVADGSDIPKQRIEWIALTPEYLRCNLTAESANEIGFARGAPPRPRWRETKFHHDDCVLPISMLRDLFDQKTGCGAIRLKARAELNHHVRETPVIEIRRFDGSGLRAALTEQFGLPYLFGSGELRDGPNTGPETGFGADCANFFVYALRRQGYQVPWCNPKQLRKYLEPVALRAELGSTKFTNEDIADGLVLHFGNHVAIVIEDRPPIETLDRTDVVVHQLEGPPEIVSTGELLLRRNDAPFDLLRRPHHQSEADLVVGGDVMLGRTIGELVRAGENPFAGIAPYFGGAPWKLVNLECVVSDKGVAVGGKAYCFRAPIEAADVLRSAGINSVSLANNHAEDFGTDALIDSLTHLKAHDIAVVGAGETPALACQPHFFTTRGNQTGALVALNETKNNQESGMVATISDRDCALRAIAQARAGADFVLCLMHWGDENTSRVTNEQRENARWLIDHDVDVVVGCHSHFIQPLDFYHGRPVVYSLGNLVFDGAPNLESWNNGQLLEVTIGSAGAKEPLIRLLPVRLDSRGFPELSSTLNDKNVWNDHCEKSPATTGAAFSLSRVQRDSKK